MFRLLVALVVAGTTASALAQAPKYPARNIQLVIPLAAGSTTDAAARLLAQHVTASLGTQIVIENKGGSATMLGSSQVAKADPDGHTLLMGASALTVNQNLFKTVPYDTEKDFVPISLLITSPLVMAVTPRLGVKTLGEFLAKFKGAQDVTFASGGAGTMPHVAGEVFKVHSGIDMRHVPYRGGGPAMTDVIAGHVHMMFGTPVIRQNIEKGDVVALAVTGNKRAATLPNVPTFAEAGLPMPEVENGAWFGLLAPAGTPREVVALLNREFNAALALPEVREGLQKIGLEARGTTPDEFSAFIRDEIRRWPPVFAKAGIKPQ